MESLPKTIHYTDALSLYGAPFGQGSGLTLEFISCTGSEQKLIDCSNVDYPEHYNYCHHSDGVGVRCCK